MLTIHNAGYQGWFPPQTMEKLLLPWDMFTFDKLEHYDTVDFLKGGIVYADAITTVSRQIRRRDSNPRVRQRPRRTSCGSAAAISSASSTASTTTSGTRRPTRTLRRTTPPKILPARKSAGAICLHAFGFEGVGDDTAVIGVVSRFATQKGFDFIVEIMDKLVEEDMVLVILGNGEEYYERLLVEMAARHPEKVRVQVKFDNVMAHKIEAGADIFLMPSRYEPGGLNQIYSLKYGTIPVVRATGGLDDTIDEQPFGGGNGFKFWGYSPWALMDALKRALGTFRNKEEWTGMMKRGMAQDFSWDAPAREYERVYERVIQNRS